jgi:hypothetical protein
MSGDLVAFLRARLDEDEQVARAAAEPEGACWVGSSESGHPWRFSEGRGVYAEIENVGESRWPQIVGADADAVQDHVAVHDPARVLAEVAAKRALLDAMIGPALSVARAGTCDAGLATARFLALPYADHPDYQEAWRP